MDKISPTVSPTPPGEENNNPTAPVNEATGPKKRPASRLWLQLACAWIVIVVVVWLVLHPLFEVEFPAQAANGLALLNVLIDIGLLGLVSLGSGAVGSWLLRLVWSESRVLSGLERVVLAVGLGLGTNIMLVLGLGVLGGLNRPVAYGLLAVELGLAGLWRQRTSPEERWRIGEGWPQTKAGWRLMVGWERWLVVWLGGVALATLLLALTPPIAWDSLMYHLEGPKRYIEAGRIMELPRLGQAGFPFGAEMLFTWGMLLHGEGLAQAISWLYGILGALACMAFARRFFGSLAVAESGLKRVRQAGWLAAGLYLSVPHVWLLMTWAYTDTMLAFYALLALYVFLLAMENAERKVVMLGYAALAGIMAGLALGGKYTASLADAGAFGGTLLVAALSPRKPAWRQFFMAGLVFGLTALLSFAPWLIRNLVFSGNPVAPLFGGIRGWAADEVAALAGSDGGIALTPDVVIGRAFSMVFNGRTGGLHDATVSPLFLALIPFSIWSAWRSRVVAGLWLAIGINYVGWLAAIRLSGGADHTRIMLAVFPWLALVTAYGLLDFFNNRERLAARRLLRITARLAVGLFVAVSGFILVMIFVANDPLQYHLGLESRGQRVESQLGQYYRAANFVNGQDSQQKYNVPLDAKLYMFFEPRAYYFDRTISYDHNNGGQFFYYSSRYPTPQAFHAELVRRGATHVLVGEELLKFLIDVPSYRKVSEATAGRKLLDGLVAQGYFEIIYQEKGEYTVYKIR